MGLREVKVAKTFKVALVGNPNAGKSSLFNRLTGLNQQVGNFPGVTVDRKIGFCGLSDGSKAEIIDLPGTYSLYPVSLDEKIVLKTLINPKGKDFPDFVVYVADSSNLERHLLLLSQIIDLGIPTVLALNMPDVAESKNLKIEHSLLSKELGIPVVVVNGRSGEGVMALKTILVKGLHLIKNKTFIDVKALNPELVSRIRRDFDLDNDFKALLFAQHADALDFIDPERKKSLDEFLTSQGFNKIKHQVEEIGQRYNKIGKICQRAIIKTPQAGDSLTEKLDRVLTHRVWGSFIFMGLMFVMFQAIFSWASYPMDLIDGFFAQVSGYLGNTLPEGILRDLLIEGLIAGLGGIFIFIPQIAILFGFITVLEETGYMARAVYLSDRMMQQFGLNGRSLVAIISGVACAVPAIMATRTISTWKERLITIFVTPFISCSARIPVFIVLISFVVPEKNLLGIFNVRGLVMMSMYLLGGFAAIGSAYLMKMIIKTSERSYLMLELPDYKSPHWKNVWITIIEKVKVFIFNAGKIILLISLILWVLSSYGPGNAMENAEQEAMQKYQSTLSSQPLDDLVASKRLEASYVGHLGKFIEPAIRPLGFDWKIGIALITSFAAREVFVSTIATIYSVGSSDDESTIINKMKKEVNPETGQKIYTPATSFSLLLFYVFAMQCMSTLAVVKRETKSWLIPLAQFFYMTGLAYLFSFLGYQLLA